MTWRRWLALVVASICIAASVVATTQPATAEYRPPEVPPPEPANQQARTGQVHVSPKIASVGDTMTATYTNTGGVTWKLNAPGECVGEPVPVTGEAALHSVTGVTGGETSCTWEVTEGSKGQWLQVSAGITGPCGDPQAVREGRAEYAICAGASSYDHYYVLGSGYAVSGRVTLSDGRPMVGARVTLSGPDGGTKVTDASGGYRFLVGRGGYTISAAGACVAPRARRERCQSSKSFSTPGSHGIDFVADGEGKVKGRVLDASGRPIGGVTVRVVGQGGTIVQTDGNGIYEALVPDGSYTVAASREIQVEGRPQTQRFCASRRSATSSCNTDVRVEVPPDQTINFTPADDPGLLVDIVGDVIVAGESFEIRVILTNTSEADVDNIRFATPDVGMAITPVQLTTSSPPPQHSPIVRTDGPQPALPARLAREQSVSVAYQFIATEVGQAELTVSATGTTSAGRDIRGEQVATVTINERDLTRDDFKRAVQRGTERLIAQAGDQVVDIENILSTHMETTVAPGLLPPPSAADVMAGREVALPESASGSLSKSLRTGAEMIKAGLTGYGRGFAETLRSFDLESREILNVFGAAYYDPTTRQQLSTELYNELSQLPRAALDNAGYMGQAIKEAYTPEGWDNIHTFWDDAAADLAQATQEIAVGEVELARRGIALARDNPVGAMDALGHGLGSVQAKATLQTANEVVGELTGRAATAVGGAAKRATLNAVRKTAENAAVRRVASAIGERLRIPSVPGARAPLGTPIPGGALTAAGSEVANDAADAALAMTESALSRGAQRMAYDTVLDDDNFAGAAGFSTETRDKIQGVLRRGRERFGLDFEITARTAEPLSIDVDGHAKEAWMKEKAVGAKDILLGAPQETGGQVTVFKPTRPADEVLAGAEARVAELGSEVNERYATQAKNWKEWSENPNSKLRTIVDGASQTTRDGSLRYPNGITVVESLPGQPVPYDIRYVEQLDEIGFRNQLTDRLVGEGLTEAQAARRIGEVKRQLQRHPEKFVVSPEAVPVGDNAVTFRNRLTGKPWRGDVDLESVRPVSGEWPPGRRGEMEAWFAHELRRVARVPMHGWSDAATDLPMELYPLAAEFRLSHTRSGPAAIREAKSMATRFDRMSAELDRKARRATSEAAQRAVDAATTADPAQRALLEKQARTLAKEADKHRATANKFKEIKEDLEHFADGDPDALSARRTWRPGQKAIVITEGRAVVGSGTGGR